METRYNQMITYPMPADYIEEERTDPVLAKRLAQLAMAERIVGLYTDLLKDATRGTDQHARLEAGRLGAMAIRRNVQTEIDVIEGAQ